MLYWGDFKRAIEQGLTISALTLNRHSKVTKEYKTACFLSLVYFLNRDDIQKAEYYYTELSRNY